MFHKILVPLDGSTEAERALHPALKLARAVEGEVILLRNMKTVYMTMPAMAAEYDWSWPEYSREQSRTEVHEYLDKLVEMYAPPGVTVRTATVDGDTASLIVDTAVSEEVDLIIMSAQGWSSAKVRELGSITERVLYGAPCPVFMVRVTPIKRVAVTLDGSILAEQSIQPAYNLARGLGAELTLLRVNEPLSKAYPDLDADKERELSDWNRMGAQAYLENIVRDLDEDVEMFVVQGTSTGSASAVKSILDFTKLHVIDLLVMSTHGRSGLRRWLYGSVTAKVLRESHASMLIIRPPGFEVN
jgi:nucleotide-binding universal stress UspA family protein